MKFDRSATYKGASYVHALSFIVDVQVLSNDYFQKGVQTQY